MLLVDHPAHVRFFPCIALGSYISVSTLCAALVFLCNAPAFADGLFVDPATPSASWFAAGNPRQPPSPPDHGLVDIAPNSIGWVEYKFTVPKTGWRKLVLEPALLGVEITIDPQQTPQLAQGADPFHQNDWVWLEAGSHRLRIAKFSWEGLPKVRTIRLDAVVPRQPTVFHANKIEKPTATVGHCSPLEIDAGGNDLAGVLDLSFAQEQRTLEHRSVPIPASGRPQRVVVPLPCSQPGDITVTIASNGSGQVVTQKLQYSVFDTTQVEPSFRRGALVSEIDVARKAPDYQSIETTTINSPAGAYRETGATGIKPFIRSRDPEAQGWFAYRLSGLTPGRSYLFEVEYPDDAPRVFIAAFRDSEDPANVGGGTSTRYPISLGAETGVLRPLSGQMKQMGAVIWPATSNARVIFYNYHDGMKAAVSKVRIFAVDAIDERSVPRRGERDAIYWYEEGGNFRNLVGMGHAAASVFTPVDRFLRLVRSSGATTFIPTVLIYGHQLYPSKFNIEFNNQASDLTAAFMLAGQRYGLKIIPELHPRADELLWTAKDDADFDHRLLKSWKGETYLFDEKGKRRNPPYFNLINPAVRGWYRGVIQELAERYRSYPAFAGISLRTSYWANAALNNFVSLDWGYDAETVKLYFAETGASVPSGIDLDGETPAAFGRRHDALLATQKDKWIAWRCGKVRDLYGDLVDVVHKVRPDLKIMLDISVMAVNIPPGVDRLREAGIDPDLLGKIAGLEILDGRFTHGAKESDPVWRKNMAEAMFAPNTVEGLVSHGRASMLNGMQYHEIPGEVWPSVKIGLAKPNREPWVSAAIEPPPPYNLRRYAQLLAKYDVYALGDGGNGYAFGNFGVDTFMKEFRILPRRPFELIKETPDELAIRQSGNDFYVVNLKEYSVDVKLRFDPPVQAKRLTNDASLNCDQTGCPIHLEPFSTVAFSTNTNAVLADYTVNKK